MRRVLLLTLLAGLLMIIWGIGSTDSNFAAVKWLSGIVFLVALPLEKCLIKDPIAETTDDQ